MASDPRKLEELAAALDLKERARLALRLIERLDPGSDEDTEALWLEEAERRLARYDAGETEARQRCDRGDPKRNRMIQVILLPEASEEFAAAAAYYESQQRGLGQSSIDEVELSLVRIAERPKAARAVVGDFRRRLAHHFPFTVIYRVADEHVVVAVIAHRRRRPGYWQCRT